MQTRSGMKQSQAAKPAAGAAARTRLSLPKLSLSAFTVPQTASQVPEKRRHKLLDILSALISASAREAQVGPQTANPSTKRAREVSLDWAQVGRETERRWAKNIMRTTGTNDWVLVHEPIMLVCFPAWLLGSAASLLDIPSPMWLPAAIGATIGSIFAALNRYSSVRMHVPPEKPLSVVITGGSKGLGKSLAREMLLAGDRVIITSRTHKSKDQAVAQLKQELGRNTQVFGFVCDVSNPDEVAALDCHARLIFGEVDVWINNAGYSGSFQPFIDSEPEQIEQVVGTNLLGTLLCSRQAVRLFKQQPNGGHLFNMDGAGADGLPTPNYASYGATKAGISQVSTSLQAELKGSDIKVHLLSPGMILTDLLLEGASIANKQAFNILCEQPETTAAFLAPRLRTVVARNQEATYIKYLTPASAIWRLLTAPARIGKYFDSQGQPVYPDEAERLFGRGAKATARAIAAARDQKQGLQLAYSFTLAMAIAVLMLDANLHATASTMH